MINNLEKIKKKNFFCLGNLIKERMDGGRVLLIIEE